MSSVYFKRDGKTFKRWASIGSIDGFCAHNVVYAIGQSPSDDLEKWWHESNAQFRERKLKLDKDLKENITDAQVAKVLLTDLLLHVSGTYLTFADVINAADDGYNEYEDEDDDEPVRVANRPTQFEALTNFIPKKGFIGKNNHGDNVKLVFQRKVGPYKNLNTGNMVMEMTYKVVKVREKKKTKTGV